jgi:hypothetical protein
VAQYHKALAIADDLQMRPLAARCRLGMAIAGRDRAALICAVDTLTALGMSLWRDQGERALTALR